MANEFEALGESQYFYPLNTGPGIAKFFSDKTSIAFSRHAVYGTVTVMVCPIDDVLRNPGRISIRRRDFGAREFREITAAPPSYRALDDIDLIPEDGGAMLIAVRRTETFWLYQFTGQEWQRVMRKVTTDD